MSNRINLLNQNEVSAETKELLNKVQQKFGGVPNVFKMMANSSAVLDSYLSFSGALSNGKLDAKIAERIALYIAQRNSCEYCLAAHSLIASKTGLSEEEIMLSRRGASSSAKADAALKLANAVYETRGKVEDIDLANAREAGFDQEEILEIVGNVTLNILTNLLNNVAQTELDFAKAKECSTCSK
ncbi:MAG: carboxymuconolactone decarboxylase family protein [bacterium]